ncbi:MAG: hypothetical protein AB1720_04500 [Pseudomonadota bacterium]
MRALLLLLPVLLAGCLSFSSSEAPAAPDYAAFCQDKESLCREICGSAGVQAFSCKAAPREGLEYQCQCRKPETRI